MDVAKLRVISKRMALLLRHEPGRAGLVLDPEGYVHLTDLAAALSRDLPQADIESIKDVVALIEPHKQRYSIEGDYVRANYGHSTAELITHEPAVPPAVLFHGTTHAALADIRLTGLKPMRRQYVHLTTDAGLAQSVGSRHGPACLIKVDALAAHADGQSFYQANHAFWLVDSVASKYLQLP